MFKRKGLKSDSHGVYSQLLNANKTSVSPGDIIKIKEFISGYGKIEAGKIMFSPSAEILNTLDGKSFLMHGSKIHTFQEISHSRKTEIASYLNINEEDLTEELINRERIILDSWAGQKHLLENHGTVLSLQGGLSLPGQEKPEMFYDTTRGRGTKDRNPKISTESFLNEEPPLLWNLEISKKTKPGNYQFSFILTYFNGSKFVNDHKTINIKVLHWYEKSEKFYKTIAILTAAFSIFSGSIKVYDRYFKDDSKVLNQKELYIIQKSNEIDNKIDTLTKKINHIKRDSI